MYILLVITNLVGVFLCKSTFEITHSRAELSNSQACSLSLVSVVNNSKPPLFLLPTRTDL